MAERPLYTLYKNLKAQNYDVPDDYNKFESALTRDGKSGADNRHAIYENLKAQNFDVPSTYERFYSALFVPRSNTSSRAKGGSVPMSAADRARYLAVTQSVLNTARQVNRASGNIRKTVERAKKFNANDGKVTIGFKNPLQNQNVQKNEFNYNATTGKTGTYTTTDGVEFDNEYDAAQYQDKLDKYGEEWSNAVDMGIVPSELDKVDPDLSATDVAMRQMERRQKWLNENQNRRSKELNESMHLQGSPFVASGGAVAPSSFNTAISNEANRLSDVEYGAYNTAKDYNQMLRTTLLQELKEQKQRNENAGWWKDKWNDVSNYFGAMFNTMLDPKLYSQGVMDAAISNNLLQVKKGMEDGTIKKGSNAGNAAQAMLGAIQQQQGEAAKQQQYGTKAYQYGDVSGRSLKFMGDFALSGWRNVMTTGFTKTGEKVGEKMALGALGKWFTKNTGRMLGDMAGSAALAATNQLGSTYNNVIERYVGMNNENGGVTQDKNGDLKFNEGVSLGKAIKDGFGSATIENFSEMFGEYLPGASKLLSKLGLSKVSSFFEKIGNNAYYKWLSNATNKSGIQGVMSEIAEEEFGTALHAAWGDGDGSWSDFNVFTNPDAREKQIDTCLGMFYSVGFMQAPRTAVGAINAVQYFNIKHQVNKADKFGQMMFGENWDEIKNKIDVTTNADLTKTVLDATRSDSMTAKQKGAVINYAMFLSKLRGFNQASDAKTKDKVEEGDTAPTLSNDLDDAYTEGHNADDADKHDIQIQQEDQMKTLAAALGISEQQLSGMSDEELESLTGQNDKLDQSIYDYQLSSARYQGVVDDAQDKVDLAAHQAEQRVDMYTDKSRGSVRNATIKASGGAEDYGVYIISGNIATNDDGSIDVSNSDDMILYFDPTTNSVEHADASMFAELGEELPADDVKSQAVADAKENAIKEVAGIIDGTVDVGSQFSVTDADGTEHTYEVLADNGDGTAMITIDGNVPTELVKGENVQIPYSFEDLQQMKDLEDKKRLEAAKAEREQMENERDGQQTQETEDSQPSFDFNQILNDNGNVVLVDVLGKDGNTKYPGSTLFLIRDAGAKAKVVELKSDGTLVPHAVNKEDVATISSMSLDEYKQAFATSSMIEDNSGENRGEIEAEPTTIDDETTPEVAENTETTAPADETTETPATEQTPAITLEDGTIVPILEDGNPDFSKLTASQTAELYDTEFGEDAYSIVSGYVSDAKKALDKAINMTVKGKTFVEQKVSKDAKEKAIADAQAAYDSAIAIRDAYNERQLSKVEDTAEGRKNLIEKARRKFARLKSSAKDDAEAVAQIYKETVGSLLHRLYDSTGIDVTDTIPLTAEEYVASNLGAHSLNYEGTETSKSVKQETGLSREDFAKTQLLAADGKGTTIDALVHSLWENRPSNLDSLDTQDIRNALIGVLTSGFKASEARSYVENIRIAQAEKLIEEERTASENAAYYEQQKAKEEEEKKKAELEKKAEEEKLDNESDNESNDLSNESDNEKKNDNINDNINSLTPEQQKAKEDGEKLGFPAVDKEGEPINEYVVELAEWAKEQGLKIDPTSKWNNYADLFIMCKDGFGVGTLVPDRGESINKVVYFPDNVQDFDQLWKLHEEFNVGRDIKHSAYMDNEQTQGAMFYDGDTAREFKEFVDKKVEEQNKVFGEQIPETDLPFSAKDNGKQQTTAERDADVEKNKVYDMKVVDNIVGQKTRKAFERLAKMMGANVQWQYSDKLGNGWIQETKDADGNVHRTIFITLDSSITEGAQFIFGHEMTHQIKNLNPAAYNELTKLVLDTYGSDAFEKAVDETMKRYSDAGFSGRNRDYYAEEVVADAVGEMIRDLNLAHTLAMKMSHPLLAAIHEILQKIKLAFFGTEYSDVTKNIIRSIEQAYVKTANMEAVDAATQEGEGGQRLSLRTKPEPKKTQKVYKLMRLGEDGKLYPLFIGSGEAIELGKWYDADSPKLQDLTSLSSKDYVGTRTAKKDGASVKEEYHYGAYIVNNKTGEAMSLADFKAKYSKQFARMGNNPNKKAVDWATDNGYRWIKIEEKNQGQSRYGGEARSYYNYGINGSGSVSIFAMRPGWHAGSLPTMRQIGKGSAKNLRDDTFVWVEGEIPADIDYNEEAQKNADKDIPDHIPTDGYYLKATNANKEASQADKVGWFVAGAFRANRIMSDKETRDIIDEWNAAHPDDNVEYDWKRESGKDFNTETMSLEDTPKFSLKVYHGSGADFTEFDFDHMGEGAGSQVFGWGGYVTSSKKIGKSYAEVGQQSAESRHAYSEDTPIEAAVGSILGQYMYNHQAKTFEQIKAQAIKNAENSIDSFSDMLKNSNELDEKGKKFLQKSIEKDKKELEVLRTLTEEQYKEEYIKQGRAKNLYEVYIPDDNGRNYLKWYETLSEEQINAIRDALAKNGVDVPSWEKRGFKLDLPFKDVYAAVLPMMMRCEPKEVSKFLSSLGFTGIKYPAGTIQGGAEKGDTNYVIFNPKDMKITDHTKFSIKTYHGSQASFDHFDHSFMGSGEGAQAYGWGTYVSEVEGIAKAYAKQNAAKHGMPREYKIAQLHLNHAKYEYDKVQRAYDNSKAYIDSLKEDLQNYRESMARRKEKVAYFAQNNMPETVDKLLKQIKRTEDTIKVTENDINMRTNDLEGWTQKLEEVKKKYEEEQKKFDAIPKPQIERNLYSVDIPDDTGENYIGWDEKMTHRMRDIRKEILEDNGYKLVDSDGTRDYFEDRDGKEYDLFKEQYKTGGTFYEELAQLLHSQKLASLALKEYGFDGVKVIAERNTGGNKEGKMNYVIFDENNAQITNHIKFSLRLKSAIEETETNPSDAQKESGNYKKGHIKFGGYDYTIENPKGSVRSGKDADGKEWKVTMHDTYGYIRGKFGKDGDHLDMFINDKADLDNWNGDVFVVDQVNPDGSFDEHKVMYGYDSMDDAEKAYLANYSKGWQGLGNITGASKADFDKWLDTSNRKLKPFADYAKVKFSQAQSVDNEEPKTFDEFLNHPSLKFSIKNEEQRKAAENAYEYASKLRPNKYAQYAIVDMGMPSKIPEYYEKKVLADNWRRFYNRAVRLGNYKLFDLDRPFVDQVNEVKGKVPNGFGAPNTETNKGNIKGLERQVSYAAEPRYSLKDEKTMFGMHNISLDKLRKAIKQGGFAAPSMGVIDSKNGIYSDYGEITLIPNAEKIAKRTGKNIGTYAADAWTPIYPPVEKKFGGNGGDVAYDDIESVPNEMQRLTRNAINSFMDGREANELAYLYLQEKGKAPELVYVEGKYPKELHDEVKGILGKLNGIYNTTDEQKEKLLDLFIREVYDGNREEFDNDIKKIIKKDEDLIKKRPNSNIAKNKQLDVDWMKEHGYDYGALSRFVDGILRDAETSGKVDENATMKAAQQYIQDKGMKEDFDSWKEKLNDRYNVEEVIFAGYKPDGNRKYLPNTVENAVKVMKQDGKNASVGLASFSHFVASILKPMGTLDQIRKKKVNLTGNYEDVEKFQEKWQPVYDELSDKMQPDAEPFESYGMDRLEEVATQKNPKKYAKEEYGVDLTDEDINKLNELIEAVKNDKPSIYFETKFMRPYGLDEFEKAIVPNDTPSDVVDALKMAGIDVSSYERGNAEDRQKVTMDAINSSDNIRFSLKEEKEKIVADAKANGTYMTAPNDKKTKLDAEQWATVRTANFKNWFGDWENDPENASKVVDENGEPMVVWHGRSAEFNTFEKKEGVRFIMGLEDKVKAEGFFFSPDKGLAEEFASSSYRHRGGKANVVPCFLNIRRPMDLTGEDYDRIYEDVTGWEYMVGMDTQDNLWGIMDEEGMADKIKEKGYDGAIFVEEVDDSYEPTKISYCALDSNQIKSAENNNGDFSADNNDIRFSLRYDKFEHDLNKWKKDNNLPKDAKRPTIPQRNVGESAVDFLRRVDEYRKQMALWKTAPTYEQHLLSDDTALGEFNRELQRGSVLKRIAFQDSMLAIRKAQEAIMKEVGVDHLNMAEDAYTAENRSHGKGKNEFEEYNNEFLQPLRKAYHQMKKVLGDSYDNVRIYMMAKHGLERDAQMAFKMSLDADYEDVAQRSAAYRSYKGDMNRITNDSDFEFGRVDFNTWRQRDNALRTKYSPSYMNYRYDKDGTACDYSGLSALFGGTDFEEAASKLVKDIESKHTVETLELWDATNAATKKILRDGYKAGMMSKDTYQYVRDMYSHYIPLRGWDGTTADQVWDYVGGGKGAFNQTLKTAHGRTSIADDPIAYIENMAESGILLNNKNWVKQHLMLLAQNHPTSLLTLSKAWYVKSTDANGNEEWIPATPQITSQMDSNQVKSAIDAFDQKMEQMAQTGDATQKRDGLNIAYPQTHSEEREHEVRVMKDGEEYVIYVNGDPQLAQAMNNTRAHRVREIQSGKLDRAAAWLGRKMAAAYTSLSPLFIPSNYFRDLTMTLASTAIREDAKYNYLLRKNLVTSWNLGFMLRDYQNGKLRDKVSNGNVTQKEQMFYDFMMNGGETGFVSSLDVEDLKKKFKNDLKDLDRWKTNPLKVCHTIMDSIEFLNRAIEDSNRFAVYMTSIQYGRSIDDAVNDAKNVTLNFNRKGTGEYGWQMIRNLYLFINPAVQSLQTLGALAKHHPFKFTAVTASWLASGVLVPVVNAALMSLFGGDDDKDKYWQFSKWDRRNNFIMWVPTTNEFVKIPLAQEFRAFYGLGDMIASKMMGGELAEESWSQYAEDLLGQVVDMLPLDPTGYDGNIAVSLMPNAIRPVFELAFNVDFTGKPLFKDTEYNKYDPNFTKAYVGTPDWLVRASRMMNSIGNDYPDVQQNKWDALGNPRYNLNNPAVVDHVLSSYLGGAYTMGSQVLGLLTKSLNDPKEIKVADIPLFSKFVSNPDDRPVTKKQGDEFWNMKENHDRAANTLSKLKKQAKVDGDYSMLERFYGSEEYKQYKQDDVKVKKYEEDKKKERAEESGEEYRPHKLNAEDIYKAHATPNDDFEDLKLKQLYTKLNGFKTSYDLLVDTAPSQSDDYYNTNKAAIDAIDEISLDKQEISELKKGFLDDGKDAYNAEDMKRIRELRKKVLAVLEKANKVVVANQKAKKK